MSALRAEALLPESEMREGTAELAGVWWRWLVEGFGGDELL